ncbi:MAG: imidazolonepropionase [Acidobacteriaceae bacterium]|nr:imidazolonepropionase [Acidobacteriaceae bacterium]
MEAESRSLAVLNCGELLTLAGPARPRVRDELKELSIIKDGAMLVRDGVIERVGTTEEVRSELGPGNKILDGAGRVVLPGFVDAHTHPVFAGTRVDEFELRTTGTTYEQIAERGGGIRSTVRKTRAASEQELFDGAQRYSSWFLRTGTTTIEAKSGYGLSVEDELKVLRVIRRLGEVHSPAYVPTFLGAHEIPDEYRGKASEYVNLVINEMLPAVAKLGLAEYCDVFCEPKVFDVATSRRILQAARALGLKLRLHADQLSRSGAAELAAEMNAVTADHLERIDNSGIEVLAAARVQPVLLPASVYTLGTGGFAPARKMIDAGLAVVLATDFNPGSSPTPSLPFVLSIACTHMRMTPAETLTATTVNAAYSLGRGNCIGSLEPGKRADFVIHDCRDYREISYFSGIESAEAVFVGGEVVFRRSQTSA